MSSFPERLLLGAAGLAFSGALAVPAGAQLADPLSPTNPKPIVYCPPERLAEGPANWTHRLNVFLPEGQAPAAGWPVVVTTGYGGGNAVPPVGQLRSTGGSAPLWELVRAGIAVVQFGTPGVGNDRGMWYPLGHPSGAAESFLPRHDSPEKSAQWALQWVKVQTDYPFDVERIGLRGSSGGAALAIRTAMGEDLALPTGSAQVRASTRVAAVLAIQPPTSAWALEQGPELTIAFPQHLERADAPGVAADVLAQVDPELQKDYSLMRSCFASAEARAWNARQPIALVYGDPVLRVNGAVATFALDATGFPVLHDRIVQPQQHDSWFGYVFWKRLTELSPESDAFHAGSSLFAMRDVNALPPPLDLHTHTYAGDVKGAQADALGHAWLVERLTAPPQPPPAPDRLPGVRTFGCDPEQAGTLAVLQGEPRLGTTLTVGVQAEPGATVRVYLARDSDPGFPCGGMVVAGERLLDGTRLVGPPRVAFAAPGADGWTPVALPMPSSPVLAGRALYVQGLVLPPGSTAWWTNGLVLTLLP